MKHIKNFLIFFLSLIVMFSFCSCANEENKNNNNSKVEENQQEENRKTTNVRLGIEMAAGSFTLTRSTGETQILEFFDALQVDEEINENSPIAKECFDSRTVSESWNGTIIDYWDGSYRVELPYNTTLTVPTDIYGEDSDYNEHLKKSFFFIEEKFGYMLLSKIAGCYNTEISQTGKLVATKEYEHSGNKFTMCIMRVEPTEREYLTNAPQTGDIIISCEMNNDGKQITVERITNEKFVVSFGDKTVTNFCAEYRNNEYYADTEKSSYTIIVSEDFKSLIIE